MITGGEIRCGVYGAWRLLRRDPRGIAWLDQSDHGLWRSFWGPALAMPGFMVLRSLDGSFETEPLVALLVQAIAYTMGCVAFPLVAFHIAGNLGRANQYNRYIVAYNWAAIIQMAALLPAGLLVHAFPGAVGLGLLNTAVAIILLVYQAYIAHVTLAIAPASAGMLVVLDVMIGMIITMSAERITG